MSYGMDFVYEALLAIGAMHRSSLLMCQRENYQEAVRLRVLGLRAYGDTLRLLPGHFAQNSVAEIFGVIVTLMLLTYFEVSYLRSFSMRDVANYELQCFMENPKGAFRHLWAAIQLLRSAEERLPDREISNLVPVYDAMLRLDFIAQKLVPYSVSSFSRCPDRAIMATPFWNRPYSEFAGISSHEDIIATERYRLIRLICGHNKFSRVIWGCWCPTSERPSRDELLGYYSELKLWKENSPATFASCEALDLLERLDLTAVESLPMPPPACHFSSTEAALNVAVYNSYLGCAVAMICTDDENPAAREVEAFKLVYQNLCIGAGLIERHKESLYKPCDAISMGISLMLYHGSRRCFSLEWQKWTITALRSIGREGLSNGLTSANDVEIMCDLEAKMRHGDPEHQDHPTVGSSLGHIRDRLIPLLIPRGDNEQYLAFYLRYGNTEVDGDERNIQVVARATWYQDATGTVDSLKIDIYDPAVAGYTRLPGRPQAIELFYSWRQEVEKGWHGYLTNEVQEGFLQREGLSDA